VRPRIEAHPTAARRTGACGPNAWSSISLSSCFLVRQQATRNALEILFRGMRRDWLFRNGRSGTALHAERPPIPHRKGSTDLPWVRGSHSSNESALTESWLLYPPQKKPARLLILACPKPARFWPRRTQKPDWSKALPKRYGVYGIDNVDMSKASRHLPMEERLHSLSGRTQPSAQRPRLDKPVWRAIASHALSFPAEVVSTLNAEKKYLACD